MGLCGVTLTVLTYSTFSYVTSTPVIPNHSLLSVTDLVNVATFTHCIACLFTAVTYNNDWFGITGVLVTYENVLYVSTVSVTPHSPIRLFIFFYFHRRSVKLKFDKGSKNKNLDLFIGIKTFLFQLSN